MCTSISEVAADGSHVLARTMDWPQLLSSLLFVPRQYQWHSVFDGKKYHNRYAIIGVGHASNSQVDISDGANECGLSIQKLTFKNGSKLLTTPSTDKTSLAPFELPLYLLGRFKSVADIEQHLDEIQLMNGKKAKRPYGYPELHYAAMDLTGRVVLLEPVQQPMELIENPLGVATNVFDFKQHLERLEDYLEFKPGVLEQPLLCDSSRVSTGHFAGKKVPSSSYTPGARFARAAYFRERIDIPQNEAEAVVSSWHLLNTVSVPKSKNYQRNYSVYRSAVCLESLTYYFEPYNRLGIVTLTLTEEMLHWKETHFYPVDDHLKTTAVIED